MAFNVASSVASGYGGLLTPRDLPDPRVVLSQSGTEAFQRASVNDQATLAALAKTGLDNQAALLTRDKQLDYNREADKLIAAENKRRSLLALSAGLGATGGGVRKANLGGLTGTANQLAQWNQYFTNHENLLSKRVGASTFATDAGVLEAIKRLQN